MTISQVVFRLILAVAAGILIGMERARHGRAAGMRTHVLVCIGSTLTALTGLFVYERYEVGDMFRLSAQVISGVGFLGAGMIVLKNDNVITGLTTAAGVWATASLGIAIGYGFYTAAAGASLLFLITLTLLSKFERRKKNTEVVYLEISKLERVNDILAEIRQLSEKEISYRLLTAKSQKEGHLGVEIIMDRRKEIPLEKILLVDGVVFALES